MGRAAGQRRPLNGAEIAMDTTGLRGACGPGIGNRLADEDPDTRRALRYPAVAPFRSSGVRSAVQVSWVAVQVAGQFARAGVARSGWRAGAWP